MRMLGMAFLLAGCGRSGRVESLVDAGWLGEACSAAVGLEEPPRSLLDAHLRGTHELVIGVIPGSRYPAAPAYGTDVLLAELALNESEPASPLRGVKLAVRADGPTLQSCPDCGQAWIAQHLGLPEPKSPVHGLLSLLALPLTLAFDLAFAPLRALEASTDNEVLPWMTGAVLSGMTSGISVAEDGQCTSDAPCTDTWVGAPAEDANTVPPDTMAVTWRWMHADCEVHATWNRPLPPGKDLASRLASASQHALVFDGPPDAWGVHAR